MEGGGPKIYGRPKLKTLSKRKYHDEDCISMLFISGLFRIETLKGLSLTLLISQKNGLKQLNIVMAYSQLDIYTNLFKNKNMFINLAVQFGKVKNKNVLQERKNELTNKQTNYRGKSEQPVRIFNPWAKNVFHLFFLMFRNCVTK